MLAICYTQPIVTIITAGNSGRELKLVDWQFGKKTGKFNLTDTFLSSIVTDNQEYLFSTNPPNLIPTNNFITSYREYTIL